MQIESQAEALCCPKKQYEEKAHRCDDLSIVSRFFDLHRTGIECSCQIFWAKSTYAEAKLQSALRYAQAQVPHTR